jgi:glycosyltransferase involved in cell wall biosynthesis
MVKKIVLFTDPGSFGGHEIMAVRHAAVWANSIPVYICVHTENALLIALVNEAITPQKKIGIVMYPDRPRGKFALWTSNLSPALRDPTIWEGSAVILVAGGVGACVLGYRAARCQQLAVHTSWYLPMLIRPRGLGLRFLYFRLILAVMDNVVTITDYQRRQFLLYRSTAKVTILKNFVYGPCLANVDNSGERESINFAVVGRAHRQKNHYAIIRALNRYYASPGQPAVPVCLHLIGVPESSPLFFTLKSSIVGNYTLTGTAWRANPYDANFDALLLSSDYEGDPLVIHEARIRGIAIFVQDLPELVDVLYEFEKVDFASDGVIDLILKRLKRYPDLSNYVLEKEMEVNSLNIRESASYIRTLP